MDWWLSLWTALLFFATALLAVFTLSLVVVARTQLISGRDETKGWRTIEICSRYDSDLLLDRCLRTIRDAQDSGEFAKDEHKYRMDVYLLLNYFDSIAIGIEQNLYIESVVYDQLKPMFFKYYNEFLNSTMAAKLDIDPKTDYIHLCRRVERWNSDAFETKMKAR